MNAHTSLAIVGGQRGEQLDDLTVDVDGDKTVSIGVESRDGAGFIFNCAVERRRGLRLEPKEKAPERADEERLETNRAENCRAESKRLAEWGADDAAGAEADEQREQESRGEERRPAPPG